MSSDVCIVWPSPTAVVPTGLMLIVSTPEALASNWELADSRDEFGDFVQNCFDARFRTLLRSFTEAAECMAPVPPVNLTWFEVYRPRPTSCLPKINIAASVLRRPRTSPSLCQVRRAKRRAFCHALRRGRA